MLERGLSFEGLLGQIRRLNQFVEQLEHGVSPRHAAGYAAEHPVSETAVEIAAVVCGKDYGNEKAK